MAPKKQLSPQKRGAPEGDDGARTTTRRQQQRRLSDFAATKPGSAQPPKVPKELARLGVGQGLVGPQRQTRAAAATDVRQTRSAAAPTLAKPTPAAKLAATPAGKAAGKPPASAAKAKGKTPAGARAAAASPGKAAASRARGGGKAAATGRRQHLAEAEADGETFRVGDSVYIVLDTAALEGLSEEDEDTPCMVCAGVEKAEEGRHVMLECDRCLAGCHLGCMSPPLAEVPEGEWVCAECKSGRAPAARRPATARERFLQQQGLALARIEAMWQEPDGSVQCTYRWYCLPEETHTGRQAHHLAREVFLLQQRDVDGLETILRRAHVLSPQQFAAPGGGGGEDVFVCEYQYDSAWQRFRRQTEFDSESEDEGEEWAPEGSGSDEDDEEAFHPSHELWAEQSALPGGAQRRKGGAGAGGAGGINRLRGEDFIAQVGARAVPEHARRRQRNAGGALSQARSALTLTAVPRSLPCREDERRQIQDFVEEVVEEDAGKCLYISGIPGTGKTATVLEVMRSLKRRSEAGELPRFQFVEINGLRLPSPQHAYSALYEALTGDRAGPATAAQRLEEMFSGRGGGASRRPTVVLVDEMDLLINKAQTVLYNLFEWPGRKGSRLSIIGIANTMDLPERLHPRIGSRLAGRRVVFQPYSKDQLTTIIKSRLEGVPAFQPNALEFISRKVANCSGDVRRCLELCRRAAEIAEERQRRQQRQQDEQQQQQAASGSGGQGGAAAPPQENGVVEMRHVGAAIAEMFNTGHLKHLRESCRMERLLLAAIYLETCSSGRAECLLLDVWERLRLLCSQNCEAQQYSFGSVVERAVELGAKRLIICDPGVRRVRVKVALNVAVNDLVMVLTSDAELPWLEAAISRATAAPPPAEALVE